MNKPGNPPRTHGTLKKTLERLARADVVFFMMPPIMLLLTAGTIAQREMGLYRAQHTFFSSFFFWLGPLPLPGGFTLLSLLAAGLTLKFLLKSKWSLRRSGVILAHLGALTLLIGGLATAMGARETFMIIPEGGLSAHTYDYNDKSLLVFENNAEIARLPYEKLAAWPSTALPFDIEIIDHCENCEIAKAEENIENTRSMARFMKLLPKAAEKEPEANLTGLTLRLSGTESQETNGTYIAFDGMPKPITFSKAGRKYSLIFGKNQYDLPFALRLEKFSAQYYPGTDKASAYASEIIIEDGKLSWPAKIEMNKPLRYRGYTFFQSSFENQPDGAATILAVVENKGRLLPYAGTAIIGLGLLLHAALAFVSKKGRAK